MIRKKFHLPHKEIKFACVFFLLLPGLLAAIVFNSAVPTKVRAEANAEEFVVICPIEGDILDGITVLVDRAVQREAQGAKAIVFIIDTFGGRVDSAMDIANTILEAEVPTIAFVTGRGAISAGALIAYACDYIVMAPGVNIGASTPIVPGVEMSEEMNEKSMSFLRAKYRALGEEKGHNPLIGEAMVDASIELYGARTETDGFRVYKVERNRVIESYGDTQKNNHQIGGPGDVFIQLFAQPGVEETLRNLQETFRSLTEPPSAPGTQPDTAEKTPDEPVSRELSANPAIEGLPDNARMISPAGKLLTLTTREAVEIGLAKLSTETPEKALYFLGFGPFRVKLLEMTWAEALFAFLTSPMISGLLLLCGIGGIYVEFRTPGLGWPGIIGAVCLTLFFGSRLIIGIADWLDLLLVVVGLSLLAAEIFVIPGFGIAGISGIVCLVAGIYMSLTRVPIPQYTWDFMRLRDAGLTLILAAITFSLFLALTWKVFPRTRLARGLILAHEQAAASGYTVQTTADSQSSLGLRGKSVTMLRPAGRGRFGNKTYDVMTRGEFIDTGASIEIIQVEGNRYVVREIEEQD